MHMIFLPPNRRSHPPPPPPTCPSTPSPLSTSPPAPTMASSPTDPALNITSFSLVPTTSTLSPPIWPLASRRSYQIDEGCADISMSIPIDDAFAALLLGRFHRIFLARV